MSDLELPSTAAIERSADQSPQLSGAVTGFLLAIRLCVGAMFIYSSLLKIYDPLKFLDSVYRYELIGESLGLAVSVLIPALELAIGTLLLTGTAIRVATVAAVAMLAVFTLAQLSAWARGLVIDCGCFGDSAPGGTLVGPWTIGRTAVLCLLACLLLLRRSSP